MISSFSVFRTGRFWAFALVAVFLSPVASAQTPSAVRSAVPAQAQVVPNASVAAPAVSPAVAEPKVISPLATKEAKEAVQKAPKRHKVDVNQKMLDGYGVPRGNINGPAKNRFYGMEPKKFLKRKAGFVKRKMNLPEEEYKKKLDAKTIEDQETAALMARSDNGEYINLGKIDWKNPELTKAEKETLEACQPTCEETCKADGKFDCDKRCKVDCHKKIEKMRESEILRRQRKMRNKVKHYLGVPDENGNLIPEGYMPEVPIAGFDGEGDYVDMRTMKTMIGFMREGNIELPEDLEKEMEKDPKKAGQVMWEAMSKIKYGGIDPNDISPETFEGDNLDEHNRRITEQAEKIFPNLLKTVEKQSGFKYEELMEMSTEMKGQVMDMDKLSEISKKAKIESAKKRKEAEEKAKEGN